MRLALRNYFQMVNSFPGDLYFEVSKHLGWPISRVIREKFTPDVKFLLMKYAQILRNRQKAYDEMEDQF